MTQFTYTTTCAATPDPVLSALIFKDRAYGCLTLEGENGIAYLQGIVAALEFLGSIEYFELLRAARNLITLVQLGTVTLVQIKQEDEEI